jgi:WD40 repeat protein
MRWFICLFSLFVITTLFAQDKKLPPITVVPYSGGMIDFEKQIQPILDNKCTTCHSGSIKKARLDLSSHEGIVKGGKSGTSVVAGKPAESLLIKLSGRTDAPAMPPKDEEPLTPEELSLLKAWVSQGAKGAAAGEVVAKVAATIRMTKLAERVKPVLGLSMSGDKKLIAAGRGATISIYGAEKGDLQKKLIDPTLKDDKGQPLGQSQLDLVESLIFSPDGTQLYCGGYKEVTIWDIQTGAILKKLTGFADRVVALDLSTDGKYLATAGGAPTQEGEVVVFELSTGKRVLTLTAPHSDTVFGIRFSPDGKMLATSGADKFVKVWAVQPTMRLEAACQPLQAMGSMIIPWSVPGVTLGRQTAMLSRLYQTDWSIIKPGQQLRSFEGHTHHVLDVAWRADGKVLVSAGADNVLKVWDFDKGEQIRTIAGHTKQISRLSMVRTAPMVFSACGDAGLREWNIDNGGNVRSFPGASDFLQAVAASSDGTLVAAGGEEGIVRVYNGQTGALLKTLTVGK